MSDPHLSKFNWQLARRVFEVTKPYWTSSGKRQKWLLVGFLSLLLIGSWGIYIAFNVATGNPVNKLWPAFIGNDLLISFIALHKTCFIIGVFLISLALPCLYLLFNRNIMDTGWKLLSVLIMLLFGLNGINILMSFGERDLFNALQSKNISNSWKALLTLALVFAAGVPVTICSRWVRDLLNVVWRDWLTNDLLIKYFENRKYYKISQQQSVLNPDQRTSEDVRLFTQGALSFTLIAIDSLITIVSLTAVLWSIKPLLSGIVLAYSLAGTAVAALFGKRLIGLNYQQEELEANFRYQAVHVRNNAEGIAFYSGEQSEYKSLRERFAEAIKNYKLLIRWQRNLGFFTKGYELLVAMVPIVVLAPAYFQNGSSVTFGQILQGKSAFEQILVSLSLFVTQFQVFSGFAANVNRLAGFRKELEREAPGSLPNQPRIAFSRSKMIVLDGVTLMTPGYERTLAADVKVSVVQGDSLLIVGQSGTGKSSLLRAVAGLWDSGEGSIGSPDKQDMLFLPQTPYLPLGSLRSQLIYPHRDLAVTDAELQRVLTMVNLPKIIEKFEEHGGLNATLPWSNVLSPGERQRLAFARLLLTRPRYAILDEATSALDSMNEEALYTLLKLHGITYVSVGHREGLRKYHDRLLELDGQGGWRLTDRAT